MSKYAVTFGFLVIGLTVTSSGLSSQLRSGLTPIVIQSPVSLRSAGMNGAAVAMVGDAGSVFTNPAGLATIRNIALEGSYRVMPLDGRLASVALGMRLKQFDVGFGLVAFDRGFELAQRIDSIAGDPLPTDNSFNDFEALAVASLVYRRGMIAVGGSAKGVRQRAEAGDRRAAAVDIGFAIAIFDIMAIGFSMQNLGGNLRGDDELEMPGMTRFGGMLNYVDPQESYRLLSTFEFQWLEGEGSRLVLGAEAGAVLSGVGVRVRAGWATKQIGEVHSDFTYGASMELGTANIDWAYESQGLFDEPVQRLGIRLRL